MKKKNRKMLKIRQRDYDLFKKIAESDGLEVSRLIDAVSKVCREWKRDHGSELRQLQDGLDRLKDIPDDPDRRRIITTLKFATRLIYERGDGARERIWDILEEIEEEEEKGAEEKAEELLEGIE